MSVCDDRRRQRCARYVGNPDTAQSHTAASNRHLTYDRQWVRVQIQLQSVDGARGTQFPDAGAKTTYVVLASQVNPYASG